MRGPALAVMLVAPLVLAQTPSSVAAPRVLHGKVIQVSVETRRLTVLNDPVEGWMAAMTMGYPVENADILARIHPGDLITAKVYDGDLTLHEVAIVSPVSSSQNSASTLRLEDLEAMAFARNPSLLQAESARHISEGSARQAGLFPNPTVGYYGDEIRGGYINGGKQGGFVSQTIILGGKLSAARKVANLEVNQAAASVDLQRARIALGVSISFYRVLTAQRMVEVRERQAALAADTVETARQLANTGQADRTDILQADLEQQQAQLGSGTARQNLRMAWRVLAADVGNPELPQARLEGDLEALPDLQYEDVVARALQDSPEIKLSQRTVAHAEAAFESARKVPIPDLTLNGTLARNFEPLESTARPTGLQGGAQIGVQIPLFDRNQGNIAAARAGIETTRAALARDKLRVQHSLSGLFFDYETARETALKYRTEMLPRAEQVLGLYQANYQNMAGPYTQVLMAQRTLFQLQTDELRALEAGWESALSLQNYGVTANTLAEPIFQKRQ